VKLDHIETSLRKDSTVYAPQERKKNTKIVVTETVVRRDSTGRWRTRSFPTQSGLTAVAITKIKDIIVVGCLDASERVTFLITSLNEIFDHFRRDYRQGSPLDTLLDMEIPLLSFEIFINGISRPLNAWTAASVPSMDVWHYINTMAIDGYDLRRRVISLRIQHFLVGLHFASVIRVRQSDFSLNGATRNDRSVC
jgi:hypothetical protein